MEQRKLEELLPHRGPMLLIDEAEADGERATGRVRIKGDEWFLQGHFPGNPVVPGVILCEMMAQTCCVLLSGQSRGVTPYFTGLDGIRFKKSVRPGDEVVFECEVLRRKGPFCFARGTGSVGGEVCVSGDFSFALVK